MTTRNAEEAELPDAAPAPVRPRIGGPTTTAEQPTPQDTEMEDALDALNYVHPAERDPLEIHGWDSTKTLELHNPIQRTLWVNVQGAKVLAYRAYGGRISETEEVTQLRDGIKAALSLTNNPIVSPPTPADNAAKRDTGPLCALISNLSNEKAQELISKVSSMSAEYPSRN